MAKIVGKFLDPKTNECHYIDVDNLPMLVFPSEVIQTTNNGDVVTISYEAVYYEDKDKIGICAYIKTAPADYLMHGPQYNLHQTHLSKCLRENKYMPNELKATSSLVDSKKFAEELYNICINCNHIISESKMFQQMIEEAKTNLVISISKFGHFPLDIRLSGLGFITANNQKIMTFESMCINRTENQYCVNIYDCISRVLDLGNVKNFEIEFYSDILKFKANASSENIVSDSLEKGPIKNYKIIIDNFVHDIDENKVGYPLYEKPLFNLGEPADENILQDFIHTRLSMLDSEANSRDEDFDSRFDILF